MVMNATLYHPKNGPIEVPIEGLYLPDATTGFVPHSDKAALLLDCSPHLVDVLACGPGFVAYSIFNAEGEVNLAAMAAVADISGISFDEQSDDETLQGPVLIVYV
jgi:hypothetical protein